MSHSTCAKARHTCSLVLVGEQRVLSPPRFVDRAVNDTLCGLSQLVLWDIEVLHGVLQRNPNLPQT
jgi:hypothetical protein